ARRDARRIRGAARDRARRGRARGPARLDGLGRAALDRRLRERARVPRADVGAAADERDADGARVLPRAGLGRALRVHARRRPARSSRVPRLRRDHGRDPARRARGGRRARAARPAAGVTAVLLALASAALFGGMTIAVRLGLRGGEAGAAALATVLTAAAVGVVAAALDLDVHGAWPFLLAGLIAPGGSQILFTLAVKEAGASRTSVAVGGAPVVAGGVLLAAERDRPGHVRPLGLVYAGGAAVLFATRDNLARALHGHATPETAAAATLLAGTVVAALWTRRAPTRAELRRLAPAGVLFGLSYVCLFEAYFRGRVTVVSPLVAT